MIYNRNVFNSIQKAANTDEFYFDQILKIKRIDDVL